MKKSIPISAQIANNLWLTLNEKLGVVLSQIHALQKEEERLREEMLTHEGTMHANDFDVPVQWEKFK